MSLSILTCIFKKTDEGNYFCYIKEIPEATSQGNTLEQAQANLFNALNVLIENKLNKIIDNNLFKKPTTRRIHSGSISI